MWKMKAISDLFVDLTINANDMENMENVYARCAKCVDDMLAKHFDHQIIRMNVSDDAYDIAVACQVYLMRKYARKAGFIHEWVNEGNTDHDGYYIYAFEIWSLWR